MNAVARQAGYSDFRQMAVMLRYTFGLPDDPST